MPRQKTVMPRGKRPPSAAAATSKAISNVLLGNNNQNTQAAAAAQPGPSRPTPSFGPMYPSSWFTPSNAMARARLRRASGIGVKNMNHFRRRNKILR